MTPEEILQAIEECMNDPLKLYCDCTEIIMRAQEVARLTALEDALAIAKAMGGTIAEKEAAHQITMKILALMGGETEAK